MMQLLQYHEECQVIAGLVEVQDIIWLHIDGHMIKS